MTAADLVAGIDFGGAEFTVKQAGLDSWVSIDRGWVIEDGDGDLVLHAKTKALSRTVVTRFETPAGEEVFRLVRSGRPTPTGTRYRYDLLVSETEGRIGAVDQHSAWSLWYTVTVPDTDGTFTLRRPFWVLRAPTLQNATGSPCVRVDRSTFGRRYTFTFEPVDPWVKATALCSLTYFAGFH
jgi:hypothetical protein